MAVISLTLFGACCTLFTVFCVVFWGVPVILVLQIYLGFCATLVTLGLVLSLFTSLRVSSQSTAKQEDKAFSIELDQSRKETGSSQNPRVAADYTKLVTDYQRLGPIQVVSEKSDN